MPSSVIRNATSSNILLNTTTSTPANADPRTHLSTTPSTILSFTPSTTPSTSSSPAPSTTPSTTSSNTSSTVLTSTTGSTTPSTLTTASATCQTAGQACFLSTLTGSTALTVLDNCCVQGACASALSPTCISNATPTTLIIGITTTPSTTSSTTVSITSSTVTTSSTTSTGITDTSTTISTGTTDTTTSSTIPTTRSSTPNSLCDLNDYPPFILQASDENKTVSYLGARFNPNGYFEVYVTANVVSAATFYQRGDDLAYCSGTTIYIADVDGNANALVYLDLDGSPFGPLVTVVGNGNSVNLISQQRTLDLSNGGNFVIGTSVCETCIAYSLIKIYV